MEDTAEEQMKEIVRGDGSTSYIMKNAIKLAGASIAGALLAATNM